MDWPDLLCSAVLILLESSVCFRLWSFSKDLGRRLCLFTRFKMVHGYFLTYRISLFILILYPVKHIKRMFVSVVFDLYLLASSSFITPFNLYYLLCYLKYKLLCMNLEQIGKQSYYINCHLHKIQEYTDGMIKMYI